MSFNTIDVQKHLEGGLEEEWVSGPDGVTAALERS